MTDRCKNCGHARRQHGLRSGLCGHESCQCEGFIGPEGQEWVGALIIKQQLEDEWWARRNATRENRATSEAKARA